MLYLVSDVAGFEVSGGFGPSSSGFELQRWNEQPAESDSENTSKQPCESKPKQRQATQAKFKTSQKQI